MPMLFDDLRKAKPSERLRLVGRINGIRIPQSSKSTANYLIQSLNDRDPDVSKCAIRLMSQIPVTDSLLEKEKDELNIPEFYLSRRVYEAVGKSSPKDYLMNSAGKMQGISVIGKTVESSSGSSNTVWSVETVSGTDDNRKVFLRHKNSKGEIINIEVPENGYSQKSMPLFWNQEREILYFGVTQGNSTVRSLELWEYDTKSNSFINIGDTNSHIFFSPDNKWILWETGEKYSEVGNNTVYTSQIVIYNSEKKRNYCLTGEVSLNTFKGWAIK